MSNKSSFLKKPTFAAHFACADVQTIVIDINVPKIHAQQDAAGKYSKITRLLDGIPQHAATISLLAACFDAVKESDRQTEVSFSESIEGELAPPIISSECDTWLDLAYAFAMFELFDIYGNLRTSLALQLSALNLGIDDYHLKKGFFAAYMEDCIGGQLGNHLRQEDIEAIGVGVASCASAVTFKMLQLNETQDFNVAAIRAQCMTSLIEKCRADAIKSQLVKEQIESLMVSFFHERVCESLNSMRAIFNAARTDFLAHLDEVSGAEHEAKTNVLMIVDAIVKDSKTNSLNNQMERLNILTDVLRQTAAYTPNTDEQTRQKYSSLIAEVSKHAWGKRLGAAMSVVPIAILATAFVVLTLATAGTAIPILTGLSVATLLGLSIVTGLSTVSAIAASARYLLWDGFKHKPIADAMKAVRDRKQNVTIEPVIAEAVVVPKT